VLELRRDTLRSFAGTYRHTLRRHAGDFRIELQRVDLMNAQAPFDYTIQAWV
jgi:benzoate/toluate 1,2-dioxygenase subunit beta